MDIELEERRRRTLRGASLNAELRQFSVPAQPNHLILMFFDETIELQEKKTFCSRAP